MERNRYKVRRAGWENHNVQTDLMDARKRKGGSLTDKIKKKKREPAMVKVLEESSSVPVNGPSLGEEDTGAAMQALIDELFDNTRSEETWDTAEEVEPYLDAEKRKALQVRMTYKKPDESEVVSPVPGVMWEPSPKVQSPPNEVDYTVCLYHNERLEKRVSKRGWK